MLTKTSTQKLMYSLDGEEFKEIKAEDFVTDPEIELTTLADENAMRGFYENFCKPHTFTLEIVGPHVLTSRILFRLAGKSNNWLRMHWYPMIRKKGE